MRNRVFFLGAGFSKALNSAYPTLLELSELTSTAFKDHHKDGALRRHFDSLPQGLMSNIEQLLSYLFSDWPWKSSIERSLDRALYEALVYEIFVALREIPLNPICAEYQELVCLLNTRTNPTVISLNYDTLLRQLYAENFRSSEFFVEGIRILIEERFDQDRRTSIQTPWIVDDTPFKPYRKLLTIRREWIEAGTDEDFRQVLTTAGFNITNRSLRGADVIFGLARGFRKGNLGDPRNTANVNVIHLHGSLAWKAEASNPSIRIPGDDGLDRLETIPNIVPPILDKSQHYGSAQLRDLWVKAHAAIQRAEEIVFVGFSFPPTDVSTQFLFKSAMRAGTRVLVVDTNQAVRDTYSKLFCDTPSIDLDFSFVKDDEPLRHYIRCELLGLSSAEKL